MNSKSDTIIYIFDESEPNGKKKVFFSVFFIAGLPSSSRLQFGVFRIISSFYNLFLSTSKSWHRNIWIFKCRKRIPTSQIYELFYLLFLLHANVKQLHHIDSHFSISGSLPSKEKKPNFNSNSFYFYFIFFVENKFEIDFISSESPPVTQPLPSESNEKDSPRQIQKRRRRREKKE